MIGMLWFDNDSKASLSARLARALEYYRKKYHQEPVVIYVHPLDWDPECTTCVLIKTSTQTLRHHLYLVHPESNP
jgi:hypothetical protein